MKPLQRTDGMHSKTRKLTDEQVREMRQLLAQGWTNGELAERFGVSRPAVSAIKYRRAWTGIEVIP